MVEESELSAAERLDMAAARMAATSRPAMPMGISLDDEGGEDAVGAMRDRCVPGCMSVEDVEACADEEEEGELEKMTTPELSRARRDSRRLRAASMRWTMSWSVPWEAMVRKVPPRTPAQKV